MEEIESEFMNLEAIEADETFVGQLVKLIRSGEKDTFISRGIASEEIKIAEYFSRREYAKAYLMANILEDYARPEDKDSLRSWMRLINLNQYEDVHEMGYDLDSMNNEGVRARINESSPHKVEAQILARSLKSKFTQEEINGRQCLLRIIGYLGV